MVYSFSSERQLKICKSWTYWVTLELLETHAVMAEVDTTSNARMAFIDENAKILKY